MRLPPPCHDVIRRLNSLEFHPLRLLAALLVITPVVIAHEDDPKLLDRVPPHVGAGYTPGAYLPKAGRVARRLEPGLENRNAPPGGSMSSIAGPGSGSVQFPAQNVTLLSWLPLAQLGAGANSGNDCWGYVSGSGREYALIGVSNGTAFVEISDPSDPVVVSFQAGPPSLWRDVKTYGQHAYSVSEGGGGIQVFDLSAIDSGSVTLANTVTFGGTSSTHNVAIDTVSGYLYRCGGATDTGLRIYSLSNPVSPQYVGSWHGRYVHDVQVVTYDSGPYAGKQIAFACGGFGNGSVQTGLSIVDVTNKNNIFVRSHYQYPGGRYSHQAWLSEDRQLLYLDDELDENGVLPTTTHVIDVSDLAAPQHLSSFTNGNTAIGHNLYTLGDQLFEANYRSGLRVFDISSPLAGVETASFDTWPGDDHDAFNGLWSCYPYLPSGVVIGSDLEKGLFVWWVGTPPLSLELTDAVPATISPSGGSVNLQITEAQAGDLSPGSAKLFLDDGGGVSELPLTDLGGGTFRADFPQSSCGAELRWFVGARSSNGTLWTLPAEAPFTSFRSLSGDFEQVAIADDMENGTAGWTVGAAGDTATAGQWALGDPNGGLATPEDDHSPFGTQCWQTGLNDDVDGGSTTLTSPSFDVSGWTDPILSFWYWFSKNEGTPQPSDKLRVEFSTDGGNQWSVAEAYNTTPAASVSTWIHKSYHLASYVTPSANMRVRFVVVDNNLDSEIEAAIDDFRVTEALCGCTSAPTCSAAPNSAGAGVTLSATGSSLISANDLSLHADGGVPGQFGVYFYGPNNQESVFGDGTLCVSGEVFRLLPPVAFDAGGGSSRGLDLNAPPADAGPAQIIAGSTWYFQLWYRDPAGPLGTGFNMSSGLSVSFCP